MRRFTLASTSERTKLASLRPPANSDLCDPFDCLRLPCPEDFEAVSFRRLADKAPFILFTKRNVYLISFELKSAVSQQKNQDISALPGAPPEPQTKILRDQADSDAMPLMMIIMETWHRPVGPDTWAD